MKIFRDLAQLERAAALGALQPGDRVYVAASQLGALDEAARARLTSAIAAAGARLFEDGEPEAALVYGSAERRPGGA